MTHTLQNRSKLFVTTGCAALAMGMVVSAERAEAQAINATEAFVQGSGTRIDNGTGSETIEVDTPTAVIDWTPFEDGSGNALDFLPTGTDVTFENSLSNIGGFAVLNRILPSTNGNVVVIDGTVVSQLRDAMGATTPGGTVAFYSPTGLFIGDNAVFDVGNLILTTLDIDIASFDAFTQSGGTLSLALGPNGPQTITINPGATITATAENSYFVVTAAEIQMFGTSDINGSQAFVAGDEILLTLNNGLFDIQVPVGTSAATPIDIDGNVGGPSSTGVTGDNHLIYAVASAQNDPISLLFSGNLGFQPAASAGIVNGEIIISANYDVFGRSAANGSVDGGIQQDFAFSILNNPTQADIFIDDITATSSILAVATNEVQVAAQNAASLIDGDLIMVGRRFSELTSSNGQTFDITGSVLVSADDYGVIDGGLLDPTAIDGIGGTAFIDAFNGGTLNITGDARVTARGSAGFDFQSNEGGLGQGGTAQIGSTGGTLNVDGDVFVNANGDGAEFGSLLTTSRDSIGGSAVVFARNGGQVTLNGQVTGTAIADGRDGDTFGALGSNSTGGNTRLESLNGGEITIIGDVDFDSFAIAGRSIFNSATATAQGGNSTVIVDGLGSINVGGNVTLRGAALGGENSAGIGGDGTAGSTGISVINGGSFIGGGNVNADASGTGGQGGNLGGNGIGGFAEIVANDGIIDIGTNVRLVAEGRGDLGLGGGTGSGGITTIVANVGSISIGDRAELESNGFGGMAREGSDGGNGIGGLAQIAAEGTLTQIGEIAIGGDVSVRATGVGGLGGPGAGSIEPGIGGDGIGGSDTTNVAVDPAQTGGAFLTAGVDNGQLTITGNTNLDAFGLGGNGGNGDLGQDGQAGGNAFGGLTRAGLVFHGGGNGSVNAGFAILANLLMRSDATGGIGGAPVSTGSILGDGGMATGGSAQIVTEGGALTLQDVTQLSDAIGGEGANGGDAFGGSTIIGSSGGSTVTINNISARARATGGAGQEDTGGIATGGVVQWLLTDANVQVNVGTILSAGAFGGLGNTGGGGDATAGTAQLLASDPTSSFTSTDFLSIQASAVAGTNASTTQGASATGGTVNLVNSAGGDVSAGSISLSANATGGRNIGSGAGGDAIGGNGTLIVRGGGQISSLVGSIGVTSSATGGSAEGGGEGGDGTGGLANIAVGDGPGQNGTLNSQSNITATANGSGGSGIGAGDAIGGGAFIRVTAGDLNALNSVSSRANALGGNSTSLVGFGGDGGDATGGLAVVEVIGAVGALASISANSADVSANATGGIGGQGDGSLINAGRGGEAFGGSSRTDNVAISALTNGAVVAIGDVNSTLDLTGSSSISATGTGGLGGSGGLGQAGGDGGNGFGGNAVFGNDGLANDDAVDLNDGTSVATIGGLTLTNSGFGGAGGFGGSTGDPLGNGGNGNAGVSEDGLSRDQASVIASGVNLTIGDITTNSTGVGGTGDIAGDGFGGLTVFRATSGGELVANLITAQATGTGGNGRIGGDGYGGGAAGQSNSDGGAGIGFRNGTVTVLNDALFNANGFGGVSDGGDGGDGTGGTVAFRNSELLALDLQGDLVVGGFASLTADGFGGEGSDNFTGGQGNGGLAELVAAVGGTILLDSAQISAGGLGGTGSFTAGGDGVGGTATILSRDPGTDITITNSFDFSSPLSTIAQSGLLSANGGGGQATGGSGVGGQGTGGDVTIAVSAQGSVSLPQDPNISFNRILGRGFGGASSVDGGVGGFGQAGNGLIVLDNGVLDAGPVLFSVFAFGGSSTQAFDPAATINVTGGDAEGGDRRISVLNGSTLTGEFPGGTGGGIGGDGSGTGNGGSGVGGITVYRIEDSTFNAVGRNSFDSAGGGGGRGQIGGDASGGNSQFIISNSTINLISNGDIADPSGLPVVPLFQVFNQNLAGEGVTQGGSASGGTIDVSISDSTITGGTFAITEFARAGSADAASGTGGDATSGNITLTVSNSVLEVQNGEDVQLFDFDPATGAPIPGDIQPGAISEITSVAQAGAGLNSGNASSGDITATFNGGSVVINPSSTAEGVLDIASYANSGDATDILGLSESGDVIVSFDGTTISGDNLSVRSDADSEAIQTGATLGQAVAGTALLDILGDVGVTLNTLTVSATATTTLTGQTDGGSASLGLGPGSFGSGSGSVAGPQIDLDTLNIAADGVGGTPDSSSNRHGQFALNVLAGEISTREISATATGDAAATGEIGPSVVNANSGAIEVGELLTVSTFADVAIGTTGGGSIGNADPLGLTADIVITSQNTIEFTGDDDDSVGVAGSVLNLSSNDMIINDGARIGATEVIVNSLNDEDTAILGGAGTPGGQVAGEGFTLIAEELERIEAGRFTFNQEAIPVDNSGSSTPGSQAGQSIGPEEPSLIVRDYIASGSAGDGTSNISLNVTGAGGILRIEGQAGLGDATDADSIALSAGERIEIVTPGGIGVFDLDGNPTGALLLDATDIWAADAATIGLLQDDPNFTGRNEQLATAATGSDDPLGYIRAGEVSISFDGTLLVRNTGTVTEQGGILVGDGGLFITNTSSNEADLFAYGARFDATTGELITGEDFFNEVQFSGGSTGTSGFNNLSAFNDCLINSGECAEIAPGNEPETEPEEPTEEEEIVRQEAAQTNNATSVEAAVQTAVEVVATEEESNEDFGMDFPSFVEAEEIEDDGEIDDPVASGGDASLYGRGANGNVEVGGSTDGE